MKKHELNYVNKVIRLNGSRCKVEQFYTDNFGIRVCRVRFADGSSMETEAQEVLKSKMLDSLTLH